MDALNSADMLLLEAFRFDRRSRALFHLNSGAQIPLGSRALGVLGVLVERAGDLIPKDEIMEAVWPETAVEDANLTVHISTLRRILDAGRLDGSCIQTISGRGYRFIGGVIQKDTNGRSGVETLRQRSARTAPRLSMVVLPIKNLSNDPTQEYFADAMTEDLTTDLSRIAGSFVISCNTAFTYKSRRVSAKQIGTELGIRYVLEGSVRRSGTLVRINAQLIDAETDSHVWAERFERHTSDLFALQEEITRRIAVSLDLELIAAEVARPTEHPDALDFILRGRAGMMIPASRESRTKAIGLFEQALALEPGSVAAQSYLAIALTARVLDNMTDMAACDTRRAENLAEQSLAASPRSALAHLAKANVLRAQHRYEDAISEYETVIAFNRNSASAYDRIGQCKLFTGSTAEVISLAEYAIRLSPRAPTIGLCYLRIGQVHLVESRTGEALIWLEKARGAMPAHPGIRAYLASAYALSGDTGRAATELAEACRLSADNRYSSSARFWATGYYAMPKARALFEPTYVRGLNLAGMPE